MKKMNVWEQLIDCVADYLNSEYRFDGKLRIESFTGVADAGGGEYPKDIAKYIVDYEGNPCVVVGLKEIPSETQESFKRNHVMAVLREVHRYVTPVIEHEGEDFAESEYEKFEAWMYNRGYENAIAREIAANMTLGVGVLIDCKISVRSSSENNLRIMLIYHNLEIGKDVKAIIDADREDENSKYRFKLKTMSEWDGTRRAEWVTYVPDFRNHKLKKYSERMKHEPYFKG